MGIELARQIPNVTSAAKDAIHEWRLGVEAQERTAAVMRGGVPPPPASANYNPPAAPRAVPAGPPTEPAPPQEAVPRAEVSLDPPIEWVEHKLVSILRKNLPVSETVDNVLDFLEDAAPGMIPELLTVGERMIAGGVIPTSATPAEAGILHLFQTRPILQQIPVNPRLVEFIKSFVENAKKDLAPSPQPGNVG